MSKQYKNSKTDEKTYQSLISRIDDLCNERGYDYITLARKSNVPLTTLLNITKGNTKNPGLYTIAKLCQGFEITLSEFFSK